MMIKKPKEFTFWVLVIGLSLSLIIWVVYEFTIDDPKGTVNIVKKIYYEATAILPVNPAVDLKVTLHYQEHALSCEVASLRMALNYKYFNYTFFFSFFSNLTSVGIANLFLWLWLHQNQMKLLLCR